MAAWRLRPAVTAGGRAHRAFDGHLLAVVPGTVPDLDAPADPGACALRPGQRNLSAEHGRLRAVPDGRRGETGCMGARIVMPLRVLLPCLAVCLAASGAAAIGVAGVSAAGGSVMRQADDGLRACASSMLSHGLVAVPGSGPVPGRAVPGACGMELLTASGQMLIPAAPAARGPAIP